LKKTITITVKVGNTEIHADFQVIFSDKGIDLGFQMSCVDLFGLRKLRLRVSLDPNSNTYTYSLFSHFQPYYPCIQSEGDKNQDLVCRTC
jgi:hypothetical protein